MICSEYYVFIAYNFHFIDICVSYAFAKLCKNVFMSLLTALNYVDIGTMLSALDLILNVAHPKAHGFVQGNSLAMFCVVLLFDL